MKDVVVVGIGDYAQMLRDYIEQENDIPCRVVGFSVDRQYLPQQLQDSDVQYIALEDLTQKPWFSDVSLVMGIGYTRMNRVRRQLYERCAAAGGQFTNYIHPTARIAVGSEMGMGCILFENVLVQRSCSVGNGVIMQAGSTLMHDSTVGSFSFFGAGAVVNGRCTLGENCFVGSNATIKNRIRLGDCVLVGAGTYVNCDVSENGVIVPARSVLLDRTSDTMKI